MRPALSLLLSAASAGALLAAACGFPTYGGFTESGQGGGGSGGGPGTGGEGGGCKPGFADCDGNPSNGCEADINGSLGNCGKCGNACSASHGTPTCSGGVCDIACDDGFGDCDGKIANGCETDTTQNVDHCGGCGKACPDEGGTPSCKDDKCGIASCAEGFGDCDQKPENGCETKIVDNPKACGGCGKACAAVDHGEAACKGDTCSIGECESLFDDCDGDYATGCEASLKTADDCGFCGEECKPKNGEGSCTTGTCELKTCSDGFEDCDNNAANGCEAELAISLKHCGACNKPCVNPNGDTACVAGACVPACAPDYGSCDNNPTNGCETKLSSNLNHCGKCGNACSVANGTASCTLGTCAVQSCSFGFTDCDKKYETGCEANLQSSMDNCGACGKKCTNANGTTSCVAATCTPSCSPASFASCDGNPDNGCETNTNTSLQHCGGCNELCSNQNASLATCTSGVCKLTCKTNFADCDGDPSNGCECANCPNDIFEPNETAQIQSPPMSMTSKKLDPANNVWKLSANRLDSYTPSFKNDSDVDVFYIEVQDDLLDIKDALFSISLSAIPAGATYGVKSYFICTSGAVETIYQNNQCILGQNTGPFGNWFYCDKSAPAPSLTYTYGHGCSTDDTSGVLQIEVKTLTPPAQATCSPYTLTVQVTSITPS